MMKDSRVCVCLCVGGGMMTYRQVDQESIQQLPSWRDGDQELGDTFDGQLYLSLLFTESSVGFNTIERFWVDSRKR